MENKTVRFGFGCGGERGEGTRAEGRGGGGGGGIDTEEPVHISHWNLEKL